MMETDLENIGEHVRRLGNYTQQLSGAQKTH